jgi:UDPglucose 6-dehydrogenase
LVRISVFGLGPVGLATAVCFAAKGYRVIGVDPDTDRVGQLLRGKPPLFEPKLHGLLKTTVRKKTLQLAVDPALNWKSDFAFITVGTPSNDDGSANLTYVRQAAAEIGESIRTSDKRQVVVVKSTVTPGTARTIVKPTLITGSGKTYARDFFVCSNPEFLREGNAIHDTQFPDRIIIGSDEEKGVRKLENLYRGFLRSSTPTIIRTSFENAELIKYANNVFLATKISFINCIANIAEQTLGADVQTIAAGIGLDRRIGSRFLNAGLGWGGSCFPKDLRALLSLSKSLGYDPVLIEAAIKTNQGQSVRAVEICRQELDGLRGKRIAVLGLSFKPDTDDVREAVSIPLIRQLLSEGAVVSVYDPAAMNNARSILGDTVEYVSSSTACIDGSDCCVIVTEWTEFNKIQPRVFVERMRRPFVIDGRRIYDSTQFRHAGIIFRAIGLAPVGQSKESSKRPKKRQLPV